MKEFKIQIVETLSKEITVKASSLEVARNLVEDMYRNEEIILSSDDFFGYDIK